VIYLNPPAFVLERRINQPLLRVDAAVSTGEPFRRGAAIPLESEGILSIESPLRRTLGSYDLAWRADARLLTRRGWLLARVEVTVDAWSSDATRLQLRPVARHPERWNGWRLKRYFRLAHLAADVAARELNAHAQKPQPQPAPQLVAAI